MVRIAYMRVYQPLSEFSQDERDRWLQSPESDDSVDVRAARRWLIATALPSAGAEAGEGAFVRQVDGETLVCPWRTRLRMLAGLIAFRGSIPEEVADAFVPEAEARRAARELAALSEQNPEIRAYMLHANWHVPLRWFAVFDDSERILTEDRSGLRIRYETPLEAGRGRLARALEVLETSWIDDGVAGAVKELSEWLDQFSGKGMIELDYGSVAGMFTHDELLEDHSAQEVGACIEALAEGDVTGAGRLFGRLTDRWTEVRAQEVTN